MTTTFSLDLNTGLTQVLQDGTNTYLYGHGRIAQFSASESAYFLSDALGSVRQVVDESGMITLAKAYEPYGKLMSSIGSGASAYGFTGEQQDNITNLVYLRARYYNSSMGRFLTKDSWQGDYQRPLSLNKWNYAYSNPAFNVDPSGNTPIPLYEDFDVCQSNKDNEYYKRILLYKYKVQLSEDGHGKWNFYDVLGIYTVVLEMDRKVMGFLPELLGRTAILYFDQSSTVGTYGGETSVNKVTFNADPGKVPLQNIRHEFGHVIDNGTRTFDFFSSRLANSSVYDENGKFVFGRMKGKYSRTDGLGYLRRRIWDSKRGGTVDAEQHLVAGWDDGNTAVEEWADMWANYLIGNFDLSKAPGKARDKWVKNIILEAIGQIQVPEGDKW